jgi:ribosomal protein L4
MGYLFGRKIDRLARVSDLKSPAFFGGGEPHVGTTREKLTPIAGRYRRENNLCGKAISNSINYTM